MITVSVFRITRVFSIISALVLFFLVFTPAAAQTAAIPMRTAVIHAHYDNVEDVLNACGIAYENIPHKSIEDYSILSNYDLIFFPCGIGISPETSINVLSRGTKLTGVELRNDEYYQIDPKKSSETIRKYIENGGIAVFSDFSLDMMKQALNNVSFYDDFPALGLQGTYEALTMREFKSFANRRSYPVSFFHSGWSVCSDAPNSEIFLKASVLTPRGPKMAILAGRTQIDDGAAFFTSFHSATPQNEFTRFIVTRAWSQKYIQKNRRYIGGWDLKPGKIVTDVTLPGENSRTYSISTGKKRFTLFGFFSAGTFRMEAYDAKGKFLGSKSGSGHVFKLDLGAQPDGISVKVIPLSVKGGTLYSIGTGAGFRLFPYYKRTAFWLLILSLFIVYHKFIKRKRFNQTPMRREEGENTL